MAKDFENITINGEDIPSGLIRECADLAFGSFFQSPELLKMLRRSIEESALICGDEMSEGQALDAVWLGVTLGLASLTIELLSARTDLSEKVRGSIKSALEKVGLDDLHDSDKIGILYEQLDDHFSGRIPRDGNLIKAWKDLAIRHREN